MLLATIVLLGVLPQSADLGRSVADVPADSANVSGAEAPKVSNAARELPSMPKPKVTADAVEPPVAAQPIRPMKPAFTRPQETRRQRVAWYALAATGSGAAAFDAYTTRLAVSGHYGTEGNPFLRPFSHSNSLYAVTQLSPVVMDYIGKRMMTSRDPWLRKLWWVPQAAGSGFSVFAGVHNLGVVK
jgi:hypothetical protein